MTVDSRQDVSGCGAGLKPAHYRDVLEGTSAVDWFEVHPENYMGAGGPPHAYLTEIRSHYPLSLHGVGMSIGGAEPLCKDHLARLKALADRYEPALVSEHLAWSTHQGRFFNDLLALPYTNETLSLVCDHVDQVQAHLDRRILLENPSTYVQFEQNDMDEISFLTDVVKRTGCGLLLDINNVYVSCTNRGEDPGDFLAKFPVNAVGEIHLAGHTVSQDETGAPLLIDTHDGPVADTVWDLYAGFIDRAGGLPTLIEWDADIPDWPTLTAETARAREILATLPGQAGARHVA